MARHSFLLFGWGHCSFYWPHPLISWHCFCLVHYSAVEGSWRALRPRHAIFEHQPGTDSSCAFHSWLIVLTGGGDQLSIKTRLVKYDPLFDQYRNTLVTGSRPEMTPRVQKSRHLIFSNTVTTFSPIVFDRWWWGQISFHRNRSLVLLQPG